MITRLYTIILIAGLSLNLSASTPNEDNPTALETEVTDPDNNNTKETPTSPINTNNMVIKITIASKSYTATLVDNSTTKEFKSMLPLTLTMYEHSGNEKYGTLSDRLATGTFNPKIIKKGDLMLFGSSTLVVFYKTFSASYCYTKIGSIDDPSGLEAALGTSSVVVMFE